MNDWTDNTILENLRYIRSDIDDLKRKMDVMLRVVGEGGMLLKNQLEKNLDSTERLATALEENTKTRSRHSIYE
jgi:hypothetical protein